MIIPADFAKDMGLDAGCPVVFQYNQDTKRISIEKAQSVMTEKGRVVEIQTSICE